jgi:uncharacterized protein (DUF433 family)
MEINGKFVRTVRKMLRTGESIETVAAELCTKFRMTDDDAYEAIEYARA